MIGRTINGKYRIEEEIGRGGLGIVYRATQIFEGGIERTVAIKSLPAFGDLKREASAIVQLDHINIVRVFDLVVDEGRYLLVMEFIGGATLRKWIDTDSTDASVVIDAWEQILNGLEAIHKKHIAHLDIKPSNIFVTGDGLLKIGDFGLAASGEQGLTRPVGTAKYMAPEAFQSFGGEPHLRFDPKPDIYSAGFLLYELFLGRSRFNELFAEVSADALFPDRRWANWHGDTSTRLQPLNILRPEISPEMSGIIEKMYAKDPGQRYSDVGDIISDLKHAKVDWEPGVQTEDPSRKPRPSGPSKAEQKATGAKSKNSSKRLYYLGGLSVLFTVAILGLALLPSRKPAPKPVIQTRTSSTTKQADHAPLPSEVTTSTGTMVLIAAGKFLTGDNNGPMGLPDFFIDKYELANSIYQGFSARAGHDFPSELAAYKRYMTSHPTFPVVNVSWSEANDFCTWAGKHLATLEEWEKAARYLDGRLWPWGNDPPAGQANLGGSEDGAEFAAPVDAFQKDVSPFGVFGLAGNVAEWTVDLAKHRDETINRLPVIKGGSYTDRLAKYGMVSPVVARYTAPSERMDGVGFRCTASVEEVQPLVEKTAQSIRK